MCLFIQNQDFQKHTEHMLNLLHGGSRLAMDQILAMSSNLTAQVRICAME